MQNRHFVAAPPGRSPCASLALTWPTPRESHPRGERERDGACVFSSCCPRPNSVNKFNSVLSHRRLYRSALALVKRQAYRAYNVCIRLTFYERSHLPVVHFAYYACVHHYIGCLYLTYLCEHANVVRYTVRYEATPTLTEPVGDCF